MTNSPVNAGPNGDGSKSLTRESKFGNILNGAAVAAALYVADALRGVDITPLPDLIEPAAIGLLGTAVGLLVSWATKNSTTSG